MILLGNKIWLNWNKRQLTWRRIATGTEASININISDPILYSLNLAYYQIKWQIDNWCHRYSIQSIGMLCGTVSLWTAVMYLRGAISQHIYGSSTQGVSKTRCGSNPAVPCQSRGVTWFSQLVCRGIFIYLNLSDIFAVREYYAERVPEKPTWYLIGECGW